MKAICEQCAGGLEFRSGLETMPCPHCGFETRYLPQRQDIPKPVLEPPNLPPADPSPHVASLRKFGRGLETALMALGGLGVVSLLLIGLSERTNVHAEEHGYLVWAFLLAIVLAIWHRVMPPLGNVLLDVLDRK